jgi:hypothetical protein
MDTPELAAFVVEAVNAYPVYPRDLEQLRQQLSEAQRQNVEHASTIARLSHERDEARAELLPLRGLLERSARDWKGALDERTAERDKARRELEAARKTHDTLPGAVKCAGDEAVRAWRSAGLDALRDLRARREGDDAPAAPNLYDARARVPSEPIDVVRVVEHLKGLNRDEYAVAVEVLAQVTTRLRTGAKEYGPLALETDKRDWVHEANKEAIDGAVYHAMERIRRDRRNAP